jgi:hypothetical protein
MRNKKFLNKLIGLTIVSGLFYALSSEIRTEAARDENYFLNKAIVQDNINKDESLSKYSDETSDDLRENINKNIRIPLRKNPEGNEELSSHSMRFFKLYGDLKTTKDESDFTDSMKKTFLVDHNKLKSEKITEEFEKLDPDVFSKANNAVHRLNFDDESFNTINRALKKFNESKNDFLNGYKDFASVFMQQINELCDRLYVLYSKNAISNPELFDGNKIEKIYSSKAFTHSNVSEFLNCFSKFIEEKSNSKQKKANNDDIKAFKTFDPHKGLKKLSEKIFNCWSSYYNGLASLDNEYSSSDFFRIFSEVPDSVKGNYSNSNYHKAIKNYISFMLTPFQFMTYNVPGNVKTMIKYPTKYTVKYDDYFNISESLIFAFKASFIDLLNLVKENSDLLSTPQEYYLELGEGEKLSDPSVAAKRAKLDKERQKYFGSIKVPSKLTNAVKTFLISADQLVRFIEQMILISDKQGKLKKLRTDIIELVENLDLKDIYSKIFVGSDSTDFEFETKYGKMSFKEMFEKYMQIFKEYSEKFEKLENINIKNIVSKNLPQYDELQYVYEDFEVDEEDEVDFNVDEVYSARENNKAMDEEDDRSTVADEEDIPEYQRYK